jgi:hypothetical protein
MTKLFVILFFFCLSGCDSTSNISKKDSTTPTKTVTVTNVLEQYTATWMQIEGVIGTGEGLDHGTPCVKVFVSSKTEAVDQKIPASVENIPIIIEVVGTIRAY